MLLGHYYVSLTEKNRTAIPKKFREELGNTGIIARWYEGCLVVVSEKNWTSFFNRLTGKSETFTEPVRDTDRFIFGSAFNISLDEQGRFVIPKVLVDYAGLKDQIVFVGLLDRIEIWDKNAWEEREKTVGEKANLLIEKLAHDKKQS